MATRKAITECPHPDAIHFALGMCRKCYQRRLNRPPRTQEQQARYTANALAKRRSDPEYRAKQKEWRRANRAWMRADHVRRHYGLSLAEDQALGNVCAICGIACDIRGRVRGGRCIDHDHKTGRVRGVLCRECNLGVAAFKDDPALLRRAAEYVS